MVACSLEDWYPSQLTSIQRENTDVNCNRTLPEQGCKNGTTQTANGFMGRHCSIGYSLNEALQNEQGIDMYVYLYL